MGSPSSVQGFEHRHAEGREVPGVTGRKHERRGRAPWLRRISSIDGERISRFCGPAPSYPPSTRRSPDRSAGFARKARRQIGCQPGGQRGAPPAFRHEGDAAPQFGDRCHADECPILVDRIEPGEHLGLGRRPPDLRQHIGVEAGPSSTRRHAADRGTCSRSRSALPQRRGQQKLRKRALADRDALRAHSSAETMTALGLPYRVMICGSVCARSITSDSRALASATVQLPDRGGFLGRCHGSLL